MRRFLITLFLVAFSSATVALSFPDLTGRVVDAAHILSPPVIQNLEQSLASYEKSSGNQLVVATLPSLEGGTIEDYGYQLGRHWGIGQKGTNNGVILIIAPHERKVRIEVGYGLEGTLTDALSNNIIQSIILPAFRQGEMENGIIDGTRAIITALGGKTDLTAQAGSGPIRQMSPQYSDTSSGFTLFSIIGLWIVFVILRVLFLPWWFPTLFPFAVLGSGSRSGLGGGFGGGFSGGGGSFGGGGASGGW